MDSCIRVSPVRDNGLACLCHLGPGSFHFAFFFFLSTFLLFYFSIFIINFCVSFIMHQGSVTLHFFIIKEKKKIENKSMQLIHFIVLLYVSLFSLCTLVTGISLIPYDLQFNLSGQFFIFIFCFFHSNTWTFKFLVDFLVMFPCCEM